MSDLVILKQHSGQSWTVLHEGRTTWFSLLSGNVDDIRESADREERRALETLRRVRRNRALADVLEAERAEATERARLERRRKTAATRARNADPFGFRAAGYLTEETTS